MIKVMSVFGTRPEAIKMCPLVKKMEENKEIESIVCLTGQHKQMLWQVIDRFGIQVHYNLNIMRPGQTLTTITTAILDRMQAVLASAKPDIVLVHGDTSTSFAAALAAFYQQIPVGHVEAGLRTYDKYSPVLPEDAGVIVRTNSREAKEEEILEEFQKLYGELQEIREKARTRTCFSLLRESMPEYMQVLQNVYTKELEEIITDNRILYEQIRISCNSPYSF